MKQARAILFVAALAVLTTRAHAAEMPMETRSSVLLSASDFNGPLAYTFVTRHKDERINRRERQKQVALPPVQINRQYKRSQVVDRYEQVNVWQPVYKTEWTEVSAEAN